jgi:hypothetical protein
MTYGEFLEGCRKVSGIENEAQFAAKLGYKDPRSYYRIKSEAQRPSLEVLERAAKLASFSFQDCIRLLVEVAPSTEEQKALTEFKRAVSSGGFVKRTALVMADQLSQMRREQRKKTS